jgi:hypothetical protein
MVKKNRQQTNRKFQHRDWGSGMASEDEATLWKRVSSNHALNALSLARSATKEEKDKENTRKIGPASFLISTMVQPAGRPSSVQTRPIRAIPPDDFKPVSFLSASLSYVFLIPPLLTFSSYYRITTRRSQGQGEISSYVIISIVPLALVCPSILTYVLSKPFTSCKNLKIIVSNNVILTFNIHLSSYLLNNF